MNRKALSLTGVMAAVAVSVTSPAAMADSKTDSRKNSKISVPIVDLNNPCTKGHDSIDGKLYVTPVLKTRGDEKSLTLEARGDARDAYGVDYLAKATLSVQFHDPFPAKLFLKAKLIRESHDNGHGGHYNDGSHHGGNGDGMENSNNYAGNGQYGGGHDDGGHGKYDQGGDKRPGKHPWFWKDRDGKDHGDKDGHGGDDKHDGDNAELDAIVYVNEHGNVVKVEISGIECKGYDKGGYGKDDHGKDNYGKDKHGKDGYGKDGYGKNGHDKNGYDSVM